MVLRKVALAVVLVLVASGAQASSNGTSHASGKHLSAHDQPVGPGVDRGDRHLNGEWAWLLLQAILDSERSWRQKVEFAYALSPISPEATEEIEAYEAWMQEFLIPGGCPDCTWILPSCYGKMRIPALIQEFGRHTRYAWIAPNIIWSEELPLVATEMADGGFVFELQDGSREYRRIERVPVDSPDAVLKFGKARRFRHPGGRATTLNELFNITNPYPDPPPKPEAVSNAISEGIFCSQSPAEDVYDNPAYFEGAWVGPKGVRGKRDCGAFIFSKADGSEIVMHSCLKR